MLDQAKDDNDKKSECEKSGDECSKKIDDTATVTENGVDDNDLVNVRSSSIELSPVKSSKYRGVCWSRQRKMWRARIKVNGKLEHLGYFDDEESAARKYDRRSYAVHKNSGIFNFPNEVLKPSVDGSKSQSLKKKHQNMISSKDPSRNSISSSSNAALPETSTATLVQTERNLRKRIGSSSIKDEVSTITDHEEDEDVEIHMSQTRNVDESQYNTAKSDILHSPPIPQHRSSGERSSISESVSSSQDEKGVMSSTSSLSHHQQQQQQLINLQPQPYLTSTMVMNQEPIQSQMRITTSHPFQLQISSLLPYWQQQQDILAGNMMRLNQQISMPASSTIGTTASIVTPLHMLSNHPLSSVLTLQYLQQQQQQQQIFSTTQQQMQMIALQNQLQQQQHQHLYDPGFSTPILPSSISDNNPNKEIRKKQKR